MAKKLGKTKLLATIIDYVFDKYCDDEQIALFAKDYYEIEKRAEERKALKKDIMISKCHDKIYKITQSVRDFLEPLVDAEYFKSTHYKHLYDESVLHDAMDQLQTKQYKKLLNTIKE